MKAALKRNAKLYQDFHERPPRRVRKVTIRLPKVVTVIGDCDFIGYRTNIAGKALRFKHTFHRGSMPRLCTDGRRLYLIGGRFKFTDRGIVDLSPRGREIE